MLKNTNPTSQVHVSWLKDLGALAIYLSVFYLLFLGTYAVFNPDESRYSEIATAMLRTRDYIIPRSNGIIFLDKPILHYWLQVLAIRVLGNNEWAFRFPPALLGILTSLATYTTGRLCFNRKTGLTAAGILATSPLFYIGAHYANLDLEVAAFISMSLMLFMIGVRQEGKHRLIALTLAYINCSLAILTKGLIGFAFPVMIIGSWILLTWQWRLITRMHLAKGLLIITLITLPWFILAERNAPEFFHYFFITQQVQRFTSSADFNNPTPFWFYVPILLVGMAPWSLFLFQSVRFKRTKEKSSPGRLFLALWLLIVILFFSIPASKPITYILPAFPAAALLIANYLNTTNFLKKKWIVALVILNTCILFALTIKINSFNNKSTKPLAIHLKNMLDKNDIVINYYKHLYDVPLYIDRPVLVVNNWNDPKIKTTDNWAREFLIGNQFQNTSDILINEEIFQKLWHGTQRVYIFVAVNFRDHFLKTTQPNYLVASYRHYTLYTNQPTHVNAIQLTRKQLDKHPEFR